MSNKNGGPAFPSGESYYTTDLSGNRTRHGKSPQYKGMTLRDYFAAMAMQAKCTDGYSSWKYLAQDAYRIADAMLAERDKE